MTDGEAVLAEHHGRPLPELVDLLVDDAWTGRAGDDLCVLAVRLAR